MLLTDVCFVMANTAHRIGAPTITLAEDRKGISHDKDIAPLIALLKMAACEWPSSEPGEVSESELFRRDQALLEMWPEACRRVGLEEREFPSAVIERWQQIGRGRPN